MKDTITPRSILAADRAWGSNERPGDIVFSHRISEEVTRVILDVALQHLPDAKAAKNISLTSLKPAPDPVGHFCLNCTKKKWFLRITGHQRKNPALENAILEHVSHAEIEVNRPLISDLTVSWKGRDYFLTIFVLINGRHFNGSDRDLRAVSAVLARLHHALKTFSLADQVRASALRTAHRLSDVKKLITHSLLTEDFCAFYELSNWARRNKEWLKIMSRQFDPYLCLMPEAQCVHGDLQIGNVIFSLQDSRVILTDFGEAPDAWFPPSFELAYLVHRFCMDQNPSVPIFRKRLNIVEKAYGRLPTDLKRIMRQVCWYLVALIIYRCVRREAIFPEEECDKFIRLEKLTDATPLLRAGY